MHDQAVKKHQEEKRRYERKQRHLQDDLRYALKKLPEAIDINMTYEAASFILVYMSALALTHATPHASLGHTLH